MSGSARRVIAPKSPAGRTPAKSASPAEYLGAGWFPINGNLLREIKKKLLAGGYRDNRRALIDDLKKDFGLLAYCLKGLNANDVFTENPMKILEVVACEEVAKILSVQEGEVSQHGFSEMLKPQALRLRHSTISCTTAEAMAEKAGMDPELAFSSALIRQLGLNLVAWNYPRIYTKALAASAEGQEDIDGILFHQLGFSPREIGVRITVPNASPDLRIGLGIDDPVDGNELGVELLRFCELSETLAQINDPEHFPAATRRWKAVAQEIGQLLGPKALTVLRERMEPYAMNYAAIPHTIMEADLSVERNLEIANRKFTETLFSENPAASKVSEELQVRLRHVYSLVRHGQVSPEALQALTAECIPHAGFVRGCVYLLDPVSNALIPKLRMGDRGLEQYKSIPGTSIISTDNPILEALQSTVPVKRDGAVLFGERVSLVTGMIGNSDKTGVLYLEMGDRLAEEGGFEPVLRFKAIRHCLNYCLNLKQAAYS